MLVGLQLSLLLTSAKVSFLSLPFSGNSGLSLPTSGASFFTSTSGRPKESNRLVFARVCMTGRIRPADSQSFLSPLLPRVCLSVRPFVGGGGGNGAFLLLLLLLLLLLSPLPFHRKPSLHYTPKEASLSVSVWLFLPSFSSFSWNFAFSLLFSSTARRFPYVYVLRPFI